MTTKRRSTGSGGVMFTVPGLKPEELDLASQDMLIEQLEQFQWFVRAHLEDSGGTLTTDGASTEQQAAAPAAGG